LGGIFGLFQRKTQFLRLIRLEFAGENRRIGRMSVSLGTSRPANKPKLLDQVRHAIRVKHYSIRTE
jgi:hypothetical protein